MPRTTVTVDGLDLYVETRGDPAAPAVLYVHGGPGQGCFHFMHAQADLLARDLYVVGVDQRGAMRSDPLPDGPGTTPLTTALLAADLDHVRRALGVERWSVIGHSAGASIALEHALASSDHVAGLVLDCPALDLDLTDRWRLPLAADLLDEIGRPEVAARARGLAAQEAPITSSTHSLLAELGERRDELFFATREAAAEFERVALESGIAEDVWRRGESHAPLLDQLYTSRLPLLGQLAVPLVLVRGVDDPVSPPAVVAAVRRSSRLVGAHDVEGARHFPSSETPEVYAAIVSQFVRQAARLP